MMESWLVWAVAGLWIAGLGVVIAALLGGRRHTPWNDFALWEQDFRRWEHEFRPLPRLVADAGGYYFQVRSAVLGRRESAD